MRKIVRLNSRGARAQQQCYVIRLRLPFRRGLRGPHQDSKVETEWSQATLSNDLRVESCACEKLVSVLPTPATGTLLFHELAP